MNIGRYVPLIMALIFMLAGLYLHFSVKDKVDNLDNVALNYCHTRRGVLETTPLRIESNIDVWFRVRDGTVYMSVRDYEAPVARFSGDSVEVLNKELWDIFALQCTIQARNKIASEAARAYALALALQVIALITGALGVIKILRARGKKSGAESSL